MHHISASSEPQVVEVAPDRLRILLVPALALGAVAFIQTNVFESDSLQVLLIAWAVPTLLLLLMAFTLHDALKTFHARRLTFMPDSVRVETLRWIGEGPRSTHTYSLEQLSHFSMYVTQRKRVYTYFVQMHLSNGARRRLYRSGKEQDASLLLARLSSALDNRRQPIASLPEHHTRELVSIEQDERSRKQLVVTPMSRPRRVLSLVCTAAWLLAIVLAYVFGSPMLQDPTLDIPLLIGAALLIVVTVLIPTYYNLKSYTLTLDGQHVDVTENILGIIHRDLIRCELDQIEVHRGHTIELVIEGLGRFQLAERMSKRELDLLDAHLSPRPEVAAPERLATGVGDSLW